MSGVETICSDLVQDVSHCGVSSSCLVFVLPVNIVETRNITITVCHVILKNVNFCISLFDRSELDNFLGHYVYQCMNGLYVFNLLSRDT